MTATVSPPSTRSTHTPQDPRRPTIPAHRRGRRLTFPATAVAIGRLFLTDDSDTRSALDLIAADPDASSCSPCSASSQC